MSGSGRSRLCKGLVVLTLIASLSACGGAKSIVINGKTYIQKGSTLYLPSGGVAGYCTAAGCQLN